MSLHSAAGSKQFSENIFMKNKIWVWYLIAVVVVLLDQLSKDWIVATYQLYQVDDITSFFKLTLRRNCGVAFSMGVTSHSADCSDVGMQRWILSAFVLIVSVGLVVWIAKMAMAVPSNSKLTDNKKSIFKLGNLELLGLALVLGGAVGNLWDRVALGYVVDFIVVHHEAWPWPEFPAFNIADSAISCGAAALIFDMLFGKKT